MLVKKKMSAQKRSILVVVAVVLLGAIGFLLYDSFLADQLSAPTTPAVDISALEVPKINAEFNDDFLQDKPYVDLRQRGSLPVRVGANEKGRTNPFRVIQFITPQE